MNAELVHITTTDGLRLDGALHAPPHDAPVEHAVDAFLLLHGPPGSHCSASAATAESPSSDSGQGNDTNPQRKQGSGRARQVNLVLRRSKEGWRDGEMRR